MSTPIKTNVDLQPGSLSIVSDDGWHVIDWYDGPLTEARAIDLGAVCGDRRVAIEFRQVDSFEPYTTKTVVISDFEIEAIAKLLAAGRLALSETTTAGGEPVRSE